MAVRNCAWLLRDISKRQETARIPVLFMGLGFGFLRILLTINGETGKIFLRSLGSRRREELLNNWFSEICAWDSGVEMKNLLLHGLTSPGLTSPRMSSPEMSTWV